MEVAEPEAAAAAAGGEDAPPAPLEAEEAPECLSPLAEVEQAAEETPQVSEGVQEPEEPSEVQAQQQSEEDEDEIVEVIEIVDLVDDETPIIPPVSSPIPPDLFFFSFSHLAGLGRVGDGQARHFVGVRERDYVLVGRRRAHEAGIKPQGDDVADVVGVARQVSAHR